MMVKSSSIRAKGPIHFRNLFSYHAGLISFLSATRVRITATSGMPKNTATLLATIEYLMLVSNALPLNTRMYSSANDADHLKYGVDGHEDSTIFLVSAGQFDSDGHHGYTSSNANKDETFSEIFLVGKECLGQSKLELMSRDRYVSDVQA
jgi:hypothetical protein